MIPVHMLGENQAANTDNKLSQNSISQTVTTQSTVPLNPSTLNVVAFSTEPNQPTSQTIIMENNLEYPI